MKVERLEGIGTASLGSRFNPKRNCHTAAVWVTLFYARTLPLARYRVRFEDDGTYRLSQGGMGGTLSAPCRANSFHCPGDRLDVCGDLETGGSLRPFAGFVNKTCLTRIPMFLYRRNSKIIETSRGFRPNEAGATCPTRSE